MDNVFKQIQPFQFSLLRKTLDELMNDLDDINTEMVHHNNSIILDNTDTYARDVLYTLKLKRQALIDHFVENIGYNPDNLCTTTK